MSHFLDGFSDELEKLAGALSTTGKWLIKKPWRRIGIPLFVGGSGVMGALAASKGGKKRAIAASPGRPSRAYYTNYHRALGTKRMSKLQEARLSRAFARHRERR